MLLQGDAAFMESLEQFEPEHRFWVGSDRIIIRGGNRKAPASSGGAREFGRQQQQHNHQPQGQGQRQQQGRFNRGRNDTRAYDRDFPPGNNTNMNNTTMNNRRGNGTGSRSVGATRGAPVWGEAPPRGQSH